MDFELELYDRLNVVRGTINKYGEDKFYISFSGGKDSTVLHHLVDMALPNNKIPRVFINTGIEYLETVRFVKEMKEKDNRIQILTVGKHIKKTLDKVGYPFKSKEHSLKMHYWKLYGEDSKTGKAYHDGKNGYGCPKILQYQFGEDFTLNISDRCCYEFKKKPIHEYEIETGKAAILGLRMNEGGQRASHSGCIVAKEGKIKKFKPLNPVSDTFIDEFVKRFEIPLSRLYTEYGFKRSGCAGCPFNRYLQDDLEKMPKVDRRKSEYIWKPVYDEYRRIGYRLRKEERKMEKCDKTSCPMNVGGYCEG